MQDYAFFFFFLNVAREWNVAISFGHWPEIYVFIYELLRNKRKKNKQECKKIFFIPLKDYFILKFVLYRVFFFVC